MSDHLRHWPSKRLRRFCLIVVAFGIGSAVAASQENVRVREYQPMCDASGGAAIDDLHFLVVNDEDNILRIFHIDRAEPVLTYDLSAFLGIEYDDKSPESDLEGVARWGDYYFFISSHGRDRKGRFRENRCRFFAVKIDRSEGFDVQPVGKPYRRLIDDLLRLPSVKRTGLIDAYQPTVKKKTELAPKVRGVNIEGLAAASSGELLIGFRNPRPKGHAIIAVLKNPLDVLLQGASAQFAPPFLIDFGGLGIRSMDWVPNLERFMIIAGAHDFAERSQLYLWPGNHSRPELYQGVRLPENWNAETLIYNSDSRYLLILSDDGTRPARNTIGETCACKDLDDPNLKKYRGMLVGLER